MKTDKLLWYKFFQKRKIEYHWHGPDCIVFMTFQQMEAFIEKIGDPWDVSSKDGGILCRWQGNSMAINITPICEYYEIPIEEIFSKEYEY